MVKSLWSFMYRTISYANKDTLTTFPNCIILILFSCHIFLPKTSSTILNRYKYLRFAHDITGNVLNFSLFSIVIVVDLSPFLTLTSPTLLSSRDGRFYQKSLFHLLRWSFGFWICLCNELHLLLYIWQMGKSVFFNAMTQDTCRKGPMPRSQ